MLRGEGGAHVWAVAPATAHYTSIPCRLPEATVVQVATRSTVTSENLHGMEVWAVAGATAQTPAPLLPAPLPYIYYYILYTL